MAARGIRRFRVAPPPNGFFAVDYQVTVNGRLAGMFADFDVQGALQKYALARQRELYSAQLPPLPSGVRGQVALAVGESWRQVASLELEDYSYAFDVLNDDSCVVARRYCAFGGAQVFRGGVEAARVSTGVGVEFLQCDAFGRVWIGYSDEGMAANDLRYPQLGVRGITQFSVSDEHCCGYAGDDFCYCYALNVGQNEAWATWHTGFPLVQFAPDFRERRWTNGLSYAGFCALAVDAEFAVLAGGFGDDANNLALVRLANDRMTPLRQFDARSLLRIEDLCDCTVVGRANVLHVICDGEWISVPIRSLVESPA